MSTVVNLPEKKMWQVSFCVHDMTISSCLVLGQTPDTASAVLSHGQLPEASGQGKVFPTRGPTSVLTEVAPSSSRGFRWQQGFRHQLQWVEES